jgi:hypothetical protein
MGLNEESHYPEMRRGNASGEQKELPLWGETAAEDQGEDSPVEVYIPP